MFGTTKCLGNANKQSLYVACHTSEINNHESLYMKQSQSKSYGQFALVRA